MIDSLKQEFKFDYFEKALYGIELIICDINNTWEFHYLYSTCDPRNSNLDEVKTWVTESPHLNLIGVNPYKIWINGIYTADAAFEREASLYIDSTLEDYSGITNK